LDIFVVSQKNKSKLLDYLQPVSRNNPEDDVFKQHVAIFVPPLPDEIVSTESTCPEPKAIDPSDKTPPEITMFLFQKEVVNLTSKYNKSRIRGSVADKSGISKILVNKTIAELNCDGLFSSDVSLVEGENKITVQAADKNGNTATHTFVIVYEKIVSATSP